jgi:hypothetical protein
MYKDENVEIIARILTAPNYSYHLGFLKDNDGENN